IAGLVHIDPQAREIVGYNPDRMDTYLTNVRLPNFKGYFVIRFSKPLAGYGVYAADRQQAGGSQAEGANVGAFASFDTSADAVVEARVGTSFISIEQARANLEAEIPNWDFAAARSALQRTWNDKLGRVVVEGASDDQRHILYSGLYHALLYPK